MWELFCPAHKPVSAKQADQAKQNIPLQSSLEDIFLLRYSRLLGPLLAENSTEYQNEVDDVSGAELASALMPKVIPHSSSEVCGGELTSCPSKTLSGCTK